MKVICSGDRNWVKPAQDGGQSALALWTMRQETVLNILSKIRSLDFLSSLLANNEFLDESLVHSEVTIVEGNARGVDDLCYFVARKLGYRTTRYPADWKVFGKSAGPVRNRQMLDQNLDVQFVFAFHDDLENSKGTKHMCQYATQRDYRVVVFSSNGESHRFHNYTRYRFGRCGVSNISS